MNQQVIDRTNWRYWIDGGGAWLERWNCTSHDYFLFGMMTVGVTWMVAEYFYYAYLVDKSQGLFDNPEFRNHLKKLVTVFCFCGSIHLFNIISWFWTPYLIWAICFWVNAFYSHWLNTTFRRAIRQKHLSDSLAESRLRDVRTTLDHIDLGKDLQNPIPSKTLTDMIEELQRKIG